jgi:pimeloyl-ACP methyl ester carboxylesterase
MELPGIDPATLQAFYKQKLSWSECDIGYQCARLRVPIDYQHPDRDTISLQLIRYVDQVKKKRVGSVVLNPGGPGGSGVDFVKSAGKAVARNLQDEFDVVSFDPRGVGDSEPVRCVSSKAEDTFLSYFADPSNAAQVAKLGALNALFAQGCLQKSGKLLAHVGTVDTARDLDILRAALGDKKLTYIGESYGTLLGAIYAQLFPKNIRAMVLDGAVDPTLTDAAAGAGQAKGFETALTSFLKWCVAQKGCALGKSSDEAEATLDQWLTGLETKPLDAAGGRQLTRSLATTAIATPLYEPTAWTALNLGLRSALAGNPAILMLLADTLNGRQSDGSYTNLIEANLAINCADRPAAFASIHDAMEAAAAAAKTAPTFGIVLGAGNTPCIGWPVPAEMSPGPVRAQGAPSIVVIGNLRDPATPYAWAESLASQLASGVLVTRDADGHTSYLRSDCVDELVTRYVVDLSAPPAGATCPAS